MATKDEGTFDYSGLYNEEDATTSLGELDLGDEVEPSEPTEPEEPTDEGEDAAAETPVDDEVEGEDAQAPEQATGDEAAELDEDADPADSDADTVEQDSEQEAPDVEPEAEKPKAKEPFIPKSRFDQRTAQLRAAERELEAMRTKVAEQETARQKAEREASTLSDEQLEAKMTQANTALLEGDTEKAAKLQAEVFGAMRQSSQASEPAQAVDPNKIAADVRDQMTFEQTLSDITQRFPALDENSDSYDEALSVEAVGFQSMYYQQGFTRAESTAKAAEAVAKIHGLEDTATPAAAPATPRKAALAKKSQQAASRAKVDKARKAPPSASGSAAAAPAESGVDLDSVTVEDWSALPDSVRSRLLGDSI